MCVLLTLKGIPQSCKESTSSQIIEKKDRRKILRFNYKYVFKYYVFL
jgi:hypothetical protein